MTETGNATSQDLASLKLPELRKIAAEKGLRGTSALRKGELIQAITTGTVPQRARQRASEQAAVENAGAENAGAESSKGDEKKSEKKDDNTGDEQRYESRSAARRARRNRAKHEQKLDDASAGPDNRDDQSGRGDDKGEHGDNSRNDGS